MLEWLVGQVPPRQQFVFDGKSLVLVTENIDFPTDASKLRSRQALLLGRRDPALRIGIQVWAARR